jgi:hypothetical protein
MATTRLETLGDWDTTTLFQQRAETSAELPAARFFLRLRAGRDEDGEIVGGGIGACGELEASVTPLGADGEPAADDLPLFPGRVVMRLLTETVEVENQDPDLAWRATRVWINDQERTGDIVDLLVDIDYPQDRRVASYSVFKKHLFGADEVQTRRIMGV